MNEEIQGWAYDNDYEKQPDGLYYLLHKKDSKIDENKQLKNRKKKPLLRRKKQTFQDEKLDHKQQSNRKSKQIVSKREKTQYLKRQVNISPLLGNKSQVLKIHVKHKPKFSQTRNNRFPFNQVSQFIAERLKKSDSCELRQIDDMNLIHVQQLLATKSNDLKFKIFEMNREEQNKTKEKTNKMPKVDKISVKLNNLELTKHLERKQEKVISLSGRVKQTKQMCHQRMITELMPQNNQNQIKIRQDASQRVHEKVKASFVSKDKKKTYTESKLPKIGNEKIEGPPTQFNDHYIFSQNSVFLNKNLSCSVSLHNKTCHKHSNKY